MDDNKTKYRTSYQLRGSIATLDRLIYENKNFEPVKEMARDLTGNVSKITELYINKVITVKISEEYWK